MRRKIAAWTITLLCTGILILASSASAEFLPRLVYFSEPFHPCFFNHWLRLFSFYLLYAQVYYDYEIAA